MFRILIAGVGGFIGASLRYIISGLSIRVFGDSFPYGTLFVNILGGLLIGFIMEASVSLWPVSPNIRIFLTTGILGGLTTFSTFSYETISMLSDGSYLMGGINAGLNLFLSLFCAWLGKFLAQVM
ncbi:putative membrane protein [Acetivibrio thermocellus BC1]|nr:putative membrane protein [Acetivibrio thermocellus BC1]